MKTRCPQISQITPAEVAGAFVGCKEYQNRGASGLYLVSVICDVRGTVERKSYPTSVVEDEMESRHPQIPQIMQNEAETWLSVARGLQGGFRTDSFPAEFI